MFVGAPVFFRPANLDQLVSFSLKARIPDSAIARSTRGNVNGTLSVVRTCLLRTRLSRPTRCGTFRIGDATGPTRRDDERSDRVRNRGNGRDLAVLLLGNRAFHQASQRCLGFGEDIDCRLYGFHSEW